MLELVKWEKRKHKTQYELFLRETKVQVIYLGYEVVK